MTTAVEFEERKRADNASSDEQPTISKFRRLNLNLPERTFQELRRLASETGRSLTEMIRVAISLLKVAIEEEGRGRKLAVIDEEGRVIKEIVPSL